MQCARHTLPQVWLLRIFKNNKLSRIRLFRDFRNHKSSQEGPEFAKHEKVCACKSFCFKVERNPMNNYMRHITNLLYTLKTQRHIEQNISTYQIPKVHPIKNSILFTSTTNSSKMFSVNTRTSLYLTEVILYDRSIKKKTLSPMLIGILLITKIKVVINSIRCLSKRINIISNYIFMQTLDGSFNLLYIL